MTDISLTYKFSDRFSMDFQLVNLFNEREYSYTSFSNEAMRINKRYMIRPGNLLIGAYVTFWLCGGCIVKSRGMKEFLLFTCSVRWGIYGKNIRYKCAIVTLFLVFVTVLEVQQIAYSHIFVSKPSDKSRAYRNKNMNLQNLMIMKTL